MDFRFQISDFRLVAALAAAGLTLAGCDKNAEQAAATPVPVEVKTAVPDAVTAITAANPNTLPPTKPATKTSAPGPAEIWKEFSGGLALEEARKQVEIGPRPSGTPEIDVLIACQVVGSPLPWPPQAPPP